MSSRTRKRGRKIASKDDARRRLKEARDDYSSKEYWDKRYKQGVSWEWYCAFEHIRPLFDRFIPEWEDSRMLEIGCGDKPLAWDMRAAGYTGAICSFDFSSTVIEKLMAEKDSCDQKKNDDNVEFAVLDARKLPFQARSFDLVVDKGTVDALLCDKTGTTNARAICTEAFRMLATGGRLMVVSHVSPTTKEGDSLMSEVFLSAIQEDSALDENEEDFKGAFFWVIDVHCSGEDDDGENDVLQEGKKGGKERMAKDANSPGPSVYMIRKVARPLTRSSAKRKHHQEVSIRIHQY